MREACRACPPGPMSLLDRDQFVVLGVQLNGDVLVFIEQTCVVHLPGNWPGLACGGVPEIEHLNGPISKRLSDGHASRSLGRVRYYLDAAPRVGVKMSLRHRCKLLSAIVVHSWTVIPVSAVGNLKLNPAERIERLLSRLLAAAKNENAGLMIRIAGDMPHCKKHTETAVILPRVDDPPAGAEAG